MSTSRSALVAFFTRGLATKDLRKALARDRDSRSLRCQEGSGLSRAVPGQDLRVALHTKVKGVPIKTQAIHLSLIYIYIYIHIYLYIYLISIPVSWSSDVCGVPSTVIQQLRFLQSKLVKSPIPSVSSWWFFSTHLQNMQQSKWVHLTSPIFGVNKSCSPKYGWIGCRYQAIYIDYQLSTNSSPWVVWDPLMLVAHFSMLASYMQVAFPTT